MNKVLGWLKSNVLIVVFSVLIIALPICGFIGSSMWNSRIKASAEEELSSRKRAVDAASRVTYTLPPVEEGESALQETRPPNAAITRFFAEQRSARQAEIEEVVSRAVRFNKKDDRRVLVEGLFPGLEDDREERRLAREMADLIAGSGDRPSVYAGLFEEINAGKPLEKEAVARRVVDAYQTEVDRAGGDLSSLTEEELAAFNERMKGHRLGVYARRAEELSVYGSVDSLYGADPSVHSVIFREVPEGAHTATDAFVWQMDYWFVEDLLSAVGMANRTEDGLMTEIPRSPVKRIVSIRLNRLEFPEVGPSAGRPDEGQGMGGRRASPRFAPPPRMAARPGVSEVEATLTGRSPEDRNGVYQVRRGTLTVIAASDSLVRLLEAIQKTNFMTVTDVSLSEVDRWADLAEGYYYGREHVVRAEIEVESAWLHFWLSDIVTDRVASAWGVERPAPAAEQQP